MTFFQGAYLVKTSHDPEQFTIFHNNPKLQERAGYIMSTSEPMDETEVRSRFTEGGMPTVEADRIITAARSTFDGATS